jgi:hypothetical protein
VIRGGGGGGDERGGGHWLANLKPYMRGSVLFIMRNRSLAVRKSERREEDSLTKKLW